MYVWELLDTQGLPLCHIKEQVPKGTHNNDFGSIKTFFVLLFPILAINIRIVWLYPHLIHLIPQISHSIPVESGLIPVDFGPIPADSSRFLTFLQECKGH